MIKQPFDEQDVVVEAEPANRTLVVTTIEASILQTLPIQWRNNK